MKPKDFSNVFNRAQREIRYTKGLSRKRQIIDQQLDLLHTIHMDMIEDAVRIREGEGFPEANVVINHVRSL